MTTLLLTRRLAGGAAANGGGSPIALAFHAFNDSTATHTSNGLFLPPGRLSVARYNAGYGCLLADGAEVRTYDEPLYGKHADGTIATLELQSTRSDVEFASLTFDTDRVRTLPPLTKQEVTRDFISAPCVLLPSSATYLCSTDGCLTPLVPESLVASLGGEIPAYYAGIKAYAEAAWAANGAVAVPGPNGACYEHGLVFAMYWKMTGDAEWWWRAVQTGDAMTEAATPTDPVANLGDYTGAAWALNIPGIPTTFVESIAWFYKATGHPQARQSILARAAFETTQFIQSDYDLRIGSLHIESCEPRTSLARYNAAWMAVHLEADDSTPYYDTLTFDGPAYVAAFMAYCAAALRPAASPGAWLAGIVHSGKDSTTLNTETGLPMATGNFPNFQVGYASRVLIKSYRYANAYADVPTWIATHCTYSAAAHRPVDPSDPYYVPGILTAEYESVDPSTLGSTIADRNDSILCPMYALQHAWRAYTANSATEQTRAENMLKAAHVVGSGTGYKQVGEQDYNALEAMGWLALRLGLIVYG